MIVCGIDGCMSASPPSDRDNRLPAKGGWALLYLPRGTIQMMGVERDVLQLLALCPTHALDMRKRVRRS